MSVQRRLDLHYCQIDDASAAVLGFTVAVTVGGVFGGYPALLAASVSPIESLRRAA